MAHAPRPHYWLRLGPLALFACQRSPDISVEIQDYASLLSDARDLACDCPEDLGYPTVSDCGEALKPVGTNERDCLAAVLDGHEEDAKAYLDCANAAYRDYVDCLAGNVSCADGWYDQCTADHEDAMAVCPQLPAEVDSSVLACIM